MKKMTLLYASLFFLLSHSAIAQVVLTGSLDPKSNIGQVIYIKRSSDGKFFKLLLGENSHYPIFEHFHQFPICISDLKYLKGNFKNKNIDANRIKYIGAYADITLDSYNKDTGIFKYDIKINPYKISSTPTECLTNMKGIPISGSTKYRMNNQPNLKITGKVTSINGSLSMNTTLIDGNSYFTLATTADGANVLFNVIGSSPLTILIDND